VFKRLSNQQERGMIKEKYTISNFAKNISEMRADKKLGSIKISPIDWVDMVESFPFTVPFGYSANKSNGHGQMGALMGIPVFAGQDAIVAWLGCCYCQTDAMPVKKEWGFCCSKCGAPL
jgi:hypothetical protein